MAFELYQHQKEFLARKRNRDLCAHGTGTGKSILIIERKPTLIICPKGLVTKWESEMPSATTISKETFRRDWKNLPKHDNVSVDESHHFHRHTSGLFKALYGYLKKHDVTYLTLATATPHRSTPWNLYAVGMLLGYDWSYSEFRKKYFQQIQMGWVVRNGQRVPKMIWQEKPGMDKELQAAWQRIGHFVRMEDIVDMPEIVEKVEYVGLTKTQKDALKYVFDPNPAVENTARHQVEQGIKKEYERYTTLPEHKTDRILELASEFDKLIIVCQFTAQIRELSERLSDCIVIDGHSKESHDELARKAEDRDKCAVIIQASVGAGFELPSYHIMVFASQSYGYVEYEQMIGRNKRINALHPLLRIYLLAGEIDQAVYDTVTKRKDFAIGLYEKKGLQGK